MKPKALVTGAAGFVGAVLARRLLDDGHDTQLVVRPGSERWRLADVESTVHEVDLSHAGSVRALMGDVRPDWIFHCATHGAYSTQRDWRRMVDVNVLGTGHLVEAALERGFDAFVNTGSSSEYGFTDHAPTEDAPPNPNSHYAWTKASQTSLCRFTAKTHDVHMPTLRLYSVYGPYEEPTRLVPTLAVQGLEGKLPPLVSPDVARDFVFVDDVVDAYIEAAKKQDIERGGVYNVGTGRQVSIRDAVDVVRRCLDIAVEPRWQSMPERSWDTSVWVADPRKAEAELGWVANLRFEAGFERMLGWLREEPERLRTYRDRAI